MLDQTLIVPVYLCYHTKYKTLSLTSTWMNDEWNFVVYAVH